MYPACLPDQPIFLDPCSTNPRSCFKTRSCQRSHRTHPPSALSFLWKIDRRLVIYLFPTKVFDNRASKPLTSLPDKATFTHKSMEKHVNKLYLNQDKRAYIRFYCGHSTPKESLESKDTADTLKETGTCLFLDPIQAPVTAICGWLLGTYRSLNLNHCGHLIQSNLKFKDHPVALTVCAIKLSPTDKPAVETRAAHAMCDATKRTGTNLKFKAHYNRLNASDFSTLPEGKILKYVPYFAN